VAVVGSIVVSMRLIVLAGKPHRKIINWSIEHVLSGCYGAG
jgi:hypothetical protein